MKNIPYIIISVYLIFGSYVQLLDFTLYDSKRLFQIGVFISFGILCMIGFFQPKISLNQHLPSIKNGYIRYSLVILLISGIISSILSDFLRYAILEYSFTILLLIIILLLAPRTKRSKYNLSKFVFSTALLYSSIYIIIFIGNYITSYIDPMTLIWPNKYHQTIIYDGVEYGGRETLFFVNTRFFNHTQTWTFPLLIGLLAFLKSKKWNKSILTLIILLISIWWALLLATSGRGATVGILISLLLLFLLFKKDVVPILKYTLITLTLGIVLYFILFILPAGEGTTETVLRIESSRFYRWTGALSVWWVNPLFGIGPMHYAAIGPSQMVAHPHNFYLQFLSEWGLIAFMAFSALLIIGLRSIYNNIIVTEHQSPNRIIHITFAWSLTAVLIHAFFSGIMHTPMSQMWLIFVVSWLFEFKFRGHIKHDPLIHKYFNLKNIYLVILIIVMILIINDIFHLNEIYQKYQSQYPGNNLYPRFWGQGLFPID